MAEGPWLRLLLVTLAVWRVTHLIVNEDGPWDVITRIRRRAGDGFWGGLMDCFYCASLWVSAAASFAVATTWSDRLACWLAVSGAACLLERSGRKDI